MSDRITAERDLPRGIAVAPAQSPPGAAAHTASSPARAGGGGNRPSLRRVARHEWRALAADRTSWLVAVLFTLVAGYALINGASWVRFQERTLAAVAADDAERLGSVTEQIGRIEAGAEEAPSPFRDPRRPAAVGGNLGRQHATLPPGPLTALAVGQSDIHPYYVPVSTRGRAAAISNDELENPVHLLAGRFDLAFVLVFLFPLLILALSYNLLSQEREGGTLAMLLSQPIGLRRVVGGKVLARFALVVGLAVLLTLAGALAVGVELGGGGAARLGLWVGVVVLYGAFWFGLAAAVNALGRGSAANAVALASLWLLLVVLVPALLNTAAATLYPVPSRVEMIGATREAARQASEEGSALLARYYEDHPELLPEGEVNLADFAALGWAVQRSVDQQIVPVRAHFEGQLARQQALIERFRYLSPAILAQGAFNDLAGTGDARNRHFVSQVDGFHAEWLAFFGPRILRQQMLGSDDLAALPTWSFREEPTGLVAARAGVAAGGLGLLALLIAAATTVLLRRFPVAG
jgi:ABC-2 type transport system permease protein